MIDQHISKVEPPISGRRVSSHPKRDQTDASLRVERDKADAGVLKRWEALEGEADETVRVTREQADQATEILREKASHVQPAGAADSPKNFASHKGTADADALLQTERFSADAVLEHERAERRRYLADFLVVERETTDEHLIGERSHADSSLAARDEYLAVISHDLRNFLGGLALNVELLNKDAPSGPEGDKIRNRLVASQRLVARMNRLVSDLLDIASIEAGKLALLVEQVDAKRILWETLEVFRPIALRKCIALEIDAPTSAVHFSGDHGRILQVLANLVSNAIKFTAEAGRVAVRVSGESDEIVFSVCDTGIGIAEAGLHKVFDRFHQITSDRRGIGLGLYISKSLVQAHGGRMWVESKPTVGSTFYFAIPRLPICSLEPTP